MKQKKGERLMTRIEKMLLLIAAGLVAGSGITACSKPAPSEAPAKPAPKTAAPAPAAPQATDTCSMFSASDLEEIVGKGATKNSGSKATDCEMTAADRRKNFHVSVNDVSANPEGAKKGAMAAMSKSEPVSGLGDEAYMDASGHSLIVIKGKQLILVTGVGTKMTEVKEASKKLAAKVVGKL
jgi:hypothetical protein